MKECTGTDRPLVSIVMATYNPRIDWFREQLLSLEAQTYRPLELIVLDDCSSETTMDEIKSCVKDCIRSIPYEVLKNEMNLGSTKAFEKLTSMARGEYIAYCDQDDIWHPEKIKNLLSCFSSDSVSLVYSDVQIIDESGNKRADSITEFRRRHVLYEGWGLIDKLLIQNFVIGCSMLIKKRIAASALPFINEMVHDHYLALMASMAGELVLCRAPLTSYRIHHHNQTNTLAGINSKDDYYKHKLKKFLDRMNQLEDRHLSETAEFSNIKKWAEARVSYYNGSLRDAKWIWKYKRFDFNISIFELIMLKMPEFLFLFALNKIKEGKI